MAGTDGFWECEGVDQPDMKLPGRQAKHEKRETRRVFMAVLQASLQCDISVYQWELETFIFRGYNLHSSWFLGPRVFDPTF